MRECPGCHELWDGHLLGPGEGGVVVCPLCRHPEGQRNPLGVGRCLNCLGPLEASEALLNDKSCTWIRAYGLAALMADGTPIYRLTCRTCGLVYVLDPPPAAADGATAHELPSGP